MTIAVEDLGEQRERSPSAIRAWEFPRTELERVFERFYRVDRARSRDTGGTGLGLAIVRHVTSNHDGKVTVESRPGDGSTFTISLPVLEDSPT